MRRRGNRGKEENLRIRTEGPRASGDGEGDRGGTALHPTHPPRWPVAENDETGEKKWWAKK